VTEAETVNLETLSLEIAKTTATRDKVHTHDASASMDITILETIHKIGNPDGSLPAARPHILAMVHKGEITVRSIFNDVPPVYLSDVTESNFDKWYTSKADAEKVRDRFSEAPNVAPEQNTATPAPVLAETKEERQDCRLNACEAAGLSFKDYKGRLPDGVGRVAETEGVTRQAFSTDVKEALKRRKSAKSGGITVHCT
jgi:hypothetical protein